MKKFLSKAAAWVATLPILLLPAAGFAQGLEDAKDLLGDVGSGLGETGDPSTEQLPQLIGNLINIFLSVLGIIFIVLVVYAGWLYLTSGGEEEKVKKAKRLLGQAIIGLIIIIAAYAIAGFVIASLITATT